MRLIDSHCHLHLLSDQATTAVLQRARAAGVLGYLNITISPEDVATVHALCDQHNEVWGAVGVHPCHASHSGMLTTGEIIAWSKHAKVVAIGESGLDYFRGREESREQEILFEKHIHAAQETGLPLVVHSRAAETDTIRMLRREMAAKEFKAVLHCFTGSQAMAEAGLEMGFLIGVTGIITFGRKAEALVEIFKQTPQTSFLIETDSPYLAPAPYRGKPNQPAYLYHIAKKLAELKQVSLNEIARQTTQNFLNLFLPEK